MSDEDYNKMIKIMKPNALKFLTQLIDLVDQLWNIPNVHVNYFIESLDLCKSQLYRIQII